MAGGLRLSGIGSRRIVLSLKRIQKLIYAFVFAYVRSRFSHDYDTALLMLAKRLSGRSLHQGYLSLKVIKLNLGEVMPQLCNKRPHSSCIYTPPLCLCTSPISDRTYRNHIILYQLLSLHCIRYSVIGVNLVLRHQFLCTQKFWWTT